MPAVTEAMMYTSLSRSIANAGVQVQRSQEQASSGLRVQTPDQDPVAAAQSSLMSDALANLSGMQFAANAATASLAQTDQILQVTQKLLASAEEFAIQAGGGNLYPEHMSALAAGAQSLHDEMLALANAQKDGIFVFGGFSGTEPFTNDGTYSGDTNSRQVEINPGLYIPMNLPGNQVFNVAGGQNILGMLQDFADALSATDIASVDISIQNIQASIIQVSRANARVGVYAHQADEAQSQRSATENFLRDDRAKTIEADTATSLTELVRSQAAYQAAISEASRILQDLDGGLLR